MGNDKKSITRKPAHDGFDPGAPLDVPESWAFGYYPKDEYTKSQAIAHFSNAFPFAPVDTQVYEYQIDGRLSEAQIVVWSQTGKERTYGEDGRELNGFRHSDSSYVERDTRIQTADTIQEMFDLLKDRGITPAQIARETIDLFPTVNNINGWRGQINGWLKGKRNINPARLEKMREHLMFEFDESESFYDYEDIWVVRGDQ